MFTAIMQKLNIKKKHINIAVSKLVVIKPESKILFDNKYDIAKENADNPITVFTLVVIFSILFIFYISIIIRNIVSMLYLLITKKAKKLSLAISINNCLVQLLNNDDIWQT